MLQAGRINESEYKSNLIKEKFNNGECWGISSSVDVYGCDPEIIRCSESIKKYVVELCDLIGMKRFGKTNIIHFGEDKKVAGYSMTQLIETSLISGHFANDTNNAYLDIFSCKYYDSIIMSEFTKDFFKGNYYKLNYTLRDMK